MKQPDQKGTEMGTTWNFCITGNHEDGYRPLPKKYIYMEKVGFELQWLVALNYVYLEKNDRWLVQCDL